MSCATPTLTAPGVVLRPLVAEDAPALFEALSDPQVQLYRRDDAHRSVSETERYIDESRATGLAWAITDDGGEALGRLALRINGEMGEFGIVIRRSAHGRGLGKAALRLAEAFAFEMLGLVTLRADIDSENQASLALFRSAGFGDDRLAPALRTTKLGVRDSVLLSKTRAQR